MKYKIDSDRRALIIDGKRMDLKLFSRFIRQGVNHRITYGDGSQPLNFIITQSSGESIIQPSSSQSYSFEKLYNLLLVKIYITGIGTLEMDNYL